MCRTGWDSSGAFALPDAALGTSEIFVYQNPSAVRAAISKAGTLKDWQSRVAFPADGNSRLTLALSASLASVLLRPLGMEGFGIHFRGPSSIGKTTALSVSSSVWGPPGYIQNWRTTANGLEANAEAHNDLPLCLDELGQIRGEHAAQIAYLLSGGKGTARANRTGAGAQRKEWCVVLISTGELGLDDKIRESNTQQRLMAGHTVRFIEIPADTGSGFGLFDWTPDSESLSSRDRGKAFAELLNRACQSCYGHAGPEFVSAFIADLDRNIEFAQRTIAKFTSAQSSDADEQVQRVATAFGLLAAAGELARRFGVVTWPSGNATHAAARCFRAWLSARDGSGPQELHAALAQLRLMIERHGDARFQRVDIRAQTRDYPIRDRLGYQRVDSDGEVYYLIGTENWKEILAGHDARAIAKDLARTGILKRGDGKHIQRNERLPGSKKPDRFYVLSHSALFDDGGADAED